MRRALLSAFAFGFGIGSAHGQVVLWRYGSAVKELDHFGDFDGDGVPDVLVCDTGDSVPTVLSGRDGSVLHTYKESSPPYGTAGLAGIGDVDADGVPDLIYGDPSYRDLHGNPIGFASAISGKTGTHLYDNTGGVGSSMGICLRGMGDTDGDGLPDFGFGVAALPAWVVLGSASGTTWINLSGYAADSFSNVIPTHALTPVGDIDGDGAVDFAAGCRDVNTDIGCVDVRSGKTGALLYTLVGASKDEMFGSALGSCADVDGDGVRELLLAAPKRVVNGVTAGEVVVCSGKTGATLYVVDGDTDKQHFGVDLDGLDDVDGDGIGDFVVASEGVDRIQVFSAATGRELVRFTGRGAHCVRDVGDVNGDGHDDVAATDGTEVMVRSIPFLRLSSVTPARMRWDHGGTLALTGSGFATSPNVAVKVDGVAATQVQVTSNTDLTCHVRPLSPGAHDVTVSNPFTSATLAGALTSVPDMFVVGVPAIGSPIDIHYEFETLDSTFGLLGAPPQTSIPTPPFGGALGVSPFLGLFFLKSWPTDAFATTQTIPNDPALVGVTVLLQSLSGPKLGGPGRDGAWSNVVELTIQ